MYAILQKPKKSRGVVYHAIPCECKNGHDEKGLVREVDHNIHAPVRAAVC